MNEDQINKLLIRVITGKTIPDTDNQVNIINTDNNNVIHTIKNIRKKNDDHINDLHEGENVKINNLLVEDLISNINNDKRGLIQNPEIIYFNNNKKMGIKDESMKENERFDRYNNPITHGKGGKQIVTFIDKVSKTNFINVVKVESYKKYNKMEEVSFTQKNNCCILI